MLIWFQVKGIVQDIYEKIAQKNEKVDHLYTTAGKLYFVLLNMQYF